MPYAIQPSYEELQQQNKSPLTSMIDAAVGGTEAYMKVNEFKQKRDKERLSAYMVHRQLGFSPSIAAEKSNLPYVPPAVSEFEEESGYKRDERRLGVKEKEVGIEKTKSEIEKNKADALKATSEASQAKTIWQDAAGAEVPAGTPGARQFIRSTKGELKPVTQQLTETERASTRVGNVILGKLSEVEKVLEIKDGVVGNKQPITPLGPLTDWNPGRSEGSKKLQDTLNASYDLLAMLRTGKQGEKTQVGQIKKEYPIGEHDSDATILRRIADMKTEIAGFMAGKNHSPLDDVAGEEPNGAESSTISPQAQALINRYRGK